MRLSKNWEKVCFFEFGLLQKKGTTFSNEGLHKAMANLKIALKGVMTKRGSFQLIPDF